jgi:hypothetical protein
MNNNSKLKEIRKTVSSIKPSDTRSLSLLMDYSGSLGDNISGTNYKRNLRLRLTTLRIGKIRKIIKNI